MTITSKDPFEIPSFLKTPPGQDAGKGLPKASQLVVRAPVFEPISPPSEEAAPGSPSPAILRRPRAVRFRRAAGAVVMLATATLAALATLFVFNLEFSDGATKGGQDSPSRFLAAALVQSQPSSGTQDEQRDWSNDAARLQAQGAPAERSAPDAPAPAPATVDAGAIAAPVAAAATVAAASVAQPAAAGPLDADASAAPAASPEAAVHGVTDHEIRFGMASPFSGANKEAGRQLKLGVDAAFDEANDAGGVNGRQLRLFAVDDGYEPSRTAGAMQELYEKDQVFGFIGNFGTATAAVSLPYALEQKALFLGALSGGNLLRRDPPDRYVFNFRPSYAEETGAAVRYLVKVRRIQPKDIAVFTQQDPFGDAGYDGVAKAMRALPGEPDNILRLNYKRNSIDVQDAVAQLRANRGRIKAVVMVATYRAAAKFIEKTRDLYPTMIYTNVSAVGATSLADELMLLGPRYAQGVIVTQVTPAVSSSASFVLRYKATLAKYFPGEAPDYTSLEAYIDANILIEAVKRAGRRLDGEKLIDSLESLHDLDLGIGSVLRFNANEHQGSHKVWGTQLDEAGRFQPIDLE